MKRTSSATADSALRFRMVESSQPGEARRAAAALAAKLDFTGNARHGHLGAESSS